MDKNSFKSKLADAVSDMRKLTLSRPLNSSQDTFGTDASVRRVLGRFYKDSSGSRILQLEVYTNDKVRHINIDAADAPNRLASLIAEDFGQLNIKSSRGEFEAKRSKDGSPVITRKLSLAKSQKQCPAEPEHFHNRKKI